MFEFDAGEQKRGPLHAGFEAGGAWLGCMGIFAVLMWLASQVPPRPTVAETKAPPEEKAEPFGTDRVLDPALLGDEAGCFRPDENEDVIPFGVGMARPELLSSSAFVHTPEAREARVQGVIIARCTLTCRGEVRGCRILKPLPYMEQAALDVLYSRRYKPAHYLGRPVSVSYVFALRLSPPVDPPGDTEPPGVALRP